MTPSEGISLINCTPPRFTSERGTNLSWKGKQMSASLDPGTSSLGPSSTLTMQSRRGVAIVLIAVVIWSTTPVFIDHLQTVDQLSPLQISTWRALLVTLLLALYLLVRRLRVFKLQRREIGYYVIYGVVGIGLFNLAFNTSVAVNKASVATALMFCAPVFVALGSWWVFHERLRPLQMLAMVVNLLGFALVGTVSALLAGTTGNVSGLLLGLFSGVCFALYTLLGRGAARANRVSPIVILFYTYLFGTLALVLWGLMTQGIHGLVISLDATGWALLVILSLGPTLFGYLLFTVSLRYLSAPIASLFHTLEPVMTALLAFFLLGRILTALQWLGLGLIVVSVMVIQLSALLHSRKTPSVPDHVAAGEAR
jgi:drug/metabolite transporter, DME family